MIMAKILIVEDDSTVLKSLHDMLVSENHRVECCENGGDAIQLISFNKYDLLILDWELPEKSGIEILKALRAKEDDSPVLMLTGRSHIDDKESGFQAGSDDYLTKPFNMREVRMRVTALLKRSHDLTSTRVTCGDLELDFKTHEAWLAGEALSLLPLEFALLELFMRNPHKVFSTSEILKRIWSAEAEATPAALRQCLLRIRKKLGKEQSDMIKNVYGVGYKFEP